LSLTGCAAWDRQVKDWESSQGNGLKRTLTVYDNSGNEIKKYTGKFDIETNDYGNKVKFDLNGKRVIIYNATVITEEE
jgi:hypothetical protein